MFIHDELGEDGLQSVPVGFSHLSDETEAYVFKLFPKTLKSGMSSHGYHIAQDEQNEVEYTRKQAFHGVAELQGQQI